MDASKEQDIYVPLDEQIEAARKIFEAQQVENPRTDSGESVQQLVLER